MKTYFVEEATSNHAAPDCKWAVKKKTKSGGATTVCLIPDYHTNSKGVAEGLAEILNRERKLILPLILQ